ncbi:uncharacterized protein LOC128201983 [Galleria mellonella]|uniref:Uncharacterized protein LOC128201983 n=1 Tax=Galleria mellonella TaxID=7137 RepID=A0ABM3MZ69_GALME|nr:uncharacterized protein LOC128201983 [Galleria mellonella]
MEALHTTMAALMEHFNKKMAEFQNELQTQKESTTPTTISSLESNFKVFQKFVNIALTSLQQQMELLTRQQDQMEMRSRRKMLLFHGIPESQRESVSQVISKIIVEKLDISDFSADQIGQSRRLGLFKKEKSRPILVKFRDLEMRNEVWYSKTKLKGCGITVSEFLTAVRHEAFLAARQHFGIKKCWTHDGVVIITGTDGTRHRITSMSEINKLVNSSQSLAAEASSNQSTSTCSTVPASRAKRVKK